MSGSMHSDVDTVLTDAAKVAAVAASVTGNPIAGVVAAGLSAAGRVADSVSEHVAAHQSAMATAVGAAETLAGASAPVIAALPQADQAKANGILSVISSLLSEFSKLFG